MFAGAFIFGLLFAFLGWYVAQVTGVIVGFFFGVFAGFGIGYATWAANQPGDKGNKQSPPEEGNNEPPPTSWSTDSSGPAQQQSPAFYLVACPFCRAQVQLAQQHLGTQVNCPTCGSIFAVKNL